MSLYHMLSTHRPCSCHLIQPEHMICTSSPLADVNHIDQICSQRRDTEAPRVLAQNFSEWGRDAGQAGAWSAGRRGLVECVLCRQQAGIVFAVIRPNASDSLCPSKRPCGMCVGSERLAGARRHRQSRSRGCRQGRAGSMCALRAAGRQGHAAAKTRATASSPPALGRPCTLQQRRPSPSCALWHHRQAHQTVQPCAQPCSAAPCAQLAQTQFASICMGAIIGLGRARIQLPTPVFYLARESSESGA